MLLTMLALLLQADAQAAPPLKNFFVWWQNGHLMEQIQASPGQQEKLNQALNNLQAEFLLEHTRLKQARGKMWSMMANGEAINEDIEKLHAGEVVPSSERLLQINLDARLAVRQVLTKDQIGSLLTRYPRFFQSRWFRTSRLAVLEGSVNPLDKRPDDGEDNGQ